MSGFEPVNPKADFASSGFSPIDINSDALNGFSPVIIIPPPPAGGEFTSEFTSEFT